MKLEATLTFGRAEARVFEQALVPYRRLGDHAELRDTVLETLFPEADAQQGWAAIERMRHRFSQPGRDPVDLRTLERFALILGALKAALATDLGLDYGDAEHAAVIVEARRMQIAALEPALRAVELAQAYLKAAEAALIPIVAGADEHEDDLEGLAT